MKADDMDLRPIHHRLDHRVRGHVVICMLACYFTWHLHRAPAEPLIFADEHPHARPNPVASARRSLSADAKASAKTRLVRQPIRSFRDVLNQLATLTRNDVRYGTAIVPTLAESPPSGAARLRPPHRHRPAHPHADTNKPAYGQRPRPAS